MNNKIYSFFIIGFYFICNILIFLFMHIQKIGSFTGIDISSPLFSISAFLNIIIFLLIIKYYLQILEILFMKDILRIHFYLYQKQWYVDFNDFHLNNNMIASDYIMALYLYLDELLEKEQYSFINNSLIIKKIVKGLSNIFDKLFLYISRFIYYIPYLIVSLTLIYDLYHSLIYYLHYALLYIFLTNFIKKIRKFYNEKDCLFDKTVSDYFYDSEPFYKNRRLEIYNEHFSTNDNENMEKIIAEYEELIDYFRNNLKVYYMVDEQRIKNNILLFTRAKRFHLLLVLFLINIYYIDNYDKYMIILNNYAIKPIFLLVVLIFISTRIEMKILIPSKENDGWVVSKKYQFLFNILITIQFIIALGIMLKNKITFLPEETIVDWYVIKIIEFYSIEDKLYFCERYFNFMSQKLIEENQNWVFLQEHVKSQLNITENLSLGDIRNLINSILFTWFDNV